ncbi:MAG: hypothetical protein ABSE84_31175 [Isosphaeraceae bacterium]|jgi:hypothetical protein
MSTAAEPDEGVIDVRPLGPALAGALSSTLAKTPTLEVRRLVLPPAPRDGHPTAVPSSVERVS